jgi:protein SCO1/2
MRKAFPIYLVCAALLSAVAVGAEQETPRIGIEEHLGERIPLETLSFTDEGGAPVRLAELFDRPVALTLVYYRCPSICTPLLQEMAKVADLADIAPGEDYRIVTISFDPGDTSELARTKKANMLATLARKQVPADGWRFLTGEEEQIRRITDSVGFHYARDKNEVDFIHAATVIFLSSDGEIVRYLNGTRFNPADLEMAVLDASEGNARSFMQRIQRLCYSYDPEGRAYVLQINRIILGVTLAFAAAFVAYLLSRNVARRATGAQTTGTAS